MRAVGRIEQYRAELVALPRGDWAAHLTAHSGLPGPRGNIELARAFAEEATPGQIDAAIATDDEYLTVCGVVGLGRLVAQGAPDAVLERLRGHARDQRWRVREGVAMALQRLGDDDPCRMRRVVADWSRDPHPLVQRAAVAGICEPRLLRDPTTAQAALDACGIVTASLATRPLDERRDANVRTLRQALGYCWSVAVAAAPGTGLPAFAALADSPDADVAWVMRENRGKKRLATLL